MCVAEKKLSLKEREKEGERKNETELGKRERKAERKIEKKTIGKGKERVDPMMSEDSPWIYPGAFVDFLDIETSKDDPVWVKARVVDVRKASKGPLSEREEERGKDRESGGKGESGRGERRDKGVSSFSPSLISSLGRMLVSKNRGGHDEREETAGEKERGKERDSDSASEMEREEVNEGKSSNESENESDGEDGTYVVTLRFYRYVINRVNKEKYKLNAARDWYVLVC